MILVFSEFPLTVDMTGFNSSHCCAAKPMKKRNQSVITLVRMVTVAAISGCTPIDMNSVVIAASGIPTSKGMPIGIDFTAKTMAEGMRIMLHETG